MLRSVFFYVMAIFLLAGCAPVSDSFPGSAGQTIFPGADSSITSETMAAATGTTYGNTQAATPATPPIQGVLREPIKVAILVPQSGPSAHLGEALMQAAQMAVFDLNEPNFQLIPKDTKGTASGARAAVDDAAREGVKLILGPLFSPEVEAAKAEARSMGLILVGFSTDWRLAGDNVFLMGVLPFGQAERIADYAARQGLIRIAAIVPSDTYGNAVLSAFEATAKRYGITIAKTIRIAGDGRDAATAAQQLQDGQYQAIFMPVGGQAAHVLASTLRTYNVNAKLLGTGLWDDPDILADANMAGAFYAAPSPQTRAGFERNYQRIYGSIPPRLASIGYDSAALAIVLARNAALAGRPVAYDRMAFTNPNGFSGVDGIFRFTSSGTAERGMAILQIGGGSAHLIEPAPASFQ